jgi:hypothetical protein
MACSFFFWNRLAGSSGTFIIAIPGVQINHNYLWNQEKSFVLQMLCRAF